MEEFIPGLELSEGFYREVVGPILRAELPGLAYSAAPIGPGSDVLGYDTPRSMDHEWGPRMFLFLGEDDHRVHARRISELLSRRLPPSFRGYSTGFTPPDEKGIRALRESGGGPVNHKVEVLTLESFVTVQLGLYPTEEIAAADWLCFPEQKLLELTSGKVFHDGLGKLGPLRERLRYYPKDVWLYRMAAQWKRIAQQEAFVGRAGDVGDELGSRLIAADLARDLMKLCFLVERRYAPYSKWFGTAFSRLPCAAELLPTLRVALEASAWREREGHLSRAYEFVARKFNALGVTPPVNPSTRRFYDRPYRVLFADRFVRALGEAITDREVRAIGGWYGAVDQLSDSTDLVSNMDSARKLRAIYL